MYAAGEKPGIGTYMCVRCYLELMTETDNEELPKCPDCGSGLYKKVD